MYVLVLFAYWVSVQGVYVPGGIYPRGVSVPGVSVPGVSVQGVSVQGVYVLRVGVQGVHVPGRGGGGYVLRIYLNDIVNKINCCHLTIVTVST